MKKLIVTNLLLLFVLALNTVYAQFPDNMDPETIAGKQTKEMKEKLDLNVNQEHKIREINLKYAKKMGKVMEKEGSMMSKMPEMREIQSQKDDEVRPLLTASQWDKYLAYKKERRKAMRKNMNRL